MVLGLSVPAAAFPVEEMQQADRAGSSMSLSAGLFHGTFRAACPPSGAGQELCLAAGRPPCQSAEWLCEATNSTGQVRPCEVTQHRAPLGLDIISSSAKVASLILTASNLSVLPWASCKTKEILLFCVLSVTGSSP